MIGAKVTELESLELESLRGMLRHPGPCVSAMLPPYRPGEQGKSGAALLKTYLQDATRDLTALKISEPEIHHLLLPLEQLAGEEDFQKGAHFARAIFRSPSVFRQFEMLGRLKPQFLVGSCFQIRPFLSDLALPQEFFLLKLSRKRVDLLRCAHLRAEAVGLPKGVPRTLDEFLAFEQPDHDLENRSFAGSSTGSMRRVRFGTGSARETEHTHLARFYKAVDRGIAEVLQARAEAPLVLAGVQEDLGIYRLNHKYSNLLDNAVYGSPGEWLPEEHLVREAYEIVRSDAIERAVAALKEAKERTTPARFFTDLDAILTAAAEGRVSRLFIAEDAQKRGVFDGAKRGGRWHWSEEDLLNLAAVETLAHGGLAFEIPGSEMPEGALAAAVIRY